LNVQGNYPVLQFTGGVADGDKFTVTGRSGAVTFEFNTTGEVTAGNIAVPIAAGAT